MTTIYLQRHTKYSNPRKIMPFRMPFVALSEEGKQQAHELGDFYKKKNVTAIYSSPMQRAKETARIISDAIFKVNDNRTVNYLDELLETLTPIQGISLDEYDEMTRSKSMYTNEAHKNFGGESIQDIYKRMNNCINDIIENHKNEEVIIVSHADPIMIYSIIKRGIKMDEETPLGKQAKFIPMGGAIQLTFNVNGDLEDFLELNY